MHEAAGWVADRSKMVHGVRRHRSKPRRAAKATLGTGAATAGKYDRMRDLPGLLALWPWEIQDSSLEAHQRLVAMLRRALRRERQRGIGRDWTYDVARHARLLAAYRAEAAGLKARLASVGREQFRPSEIRS